MVNVTPVLTGKQHSNIRAISSLSMYKSGNTINQGMMPDVGPLHDIANVDIVVLYFPLKLVKVIIIDEKDSQYFSPRPNLAGWDEYIRCMLKLLWNLNYLKSLAQANIRQIYAVGPQGLQRTK